MTCQKVALIFPSGAIPSACIGNKNDRDCVEFRQWLDKCQIFMSRSESSLSKKWNQDERVDPHFSNIIDRMDSSAYYAYWHGPHKMNKGKAENKMTESKVSTLTCKGKDISGGFIKGHPRYVPLLFGKQVPDFDFPNLSTWFWVVLSCKPLN